jgi:cell division protein FtsL
MITKRKKKKKSIQGIFFSVLVVFFVVSIAALLVVSNFKIRERRKELISQIETLKKEIQNLEEKNQEMKAGISESQTQDYLEKEAREKLGLKKPGEEVVAIKKIQSEEKPTEQKEEKSLWQKFLEFFKRK